MDTDRGILVFTGVVIVAIFAITFILMYMRESSSPSPQPQPKPYHPPWYPPGLNVDSGITVPGRR